MGDSIPGTRGTIATRIQVVNANPWMDRGYVVTAFQCCFLRDLLRAMTVAGMVNTCVRPRVIQSSSGERSGLGRALKTPIRQHSAEKLNGLPQRAREGIASR
jgi:hypothetical protein